MNDQAGIIESCGTCRANRGDLTAPGGVIYDDGVWRLEHVLQPIPMVGWLVLKPWRHIESMAELTEEEAASFGTVSRRAMAAMQDVLHPDKIYLCLFAEQQSFAHIHYHLIPRVANTPLERRGPGAFTYMPAAHDLNQDLGIVSEAVAIVQAIRELFAS